MNARAVVAVLLLASAGVGAYLLSRPAPAPERNGQGRPPRAGTAPVATGPRAAPFTTAAECADCHREVYDEWKRSYHGMAWTDPMVQALSNGFRMTECIDCHAPMPIHVTGVGERAAPRSHERQDGVDCLTCHLMDDGISVAAVNAVDTSGTPGACRPVAAPVMAESRACAGCHNQHNTMDEVLESGIGKQCQDCHMEPAKRASGKTGRGHVFPGSHDVEMHRRATKLDVSVADGTLTATVTNVGAGHKIPTDARHRSYNLWVSVRDAHGNLVVPETQFAEFRLYYRTDFKPSTQIAHGQSGSGTWRTPEGVKGTAKVRLTYALNPEELGLGRVTEVWTREAELR